MAAYDDDIARLETVEIRNLRVFSYASPSGRGQIALPYSRLIQTVVDEAGAVKCVRPLCTIDVWTAQLGSGDGQQTADAGAAFYRSALGTAAATR